VTASTTMVRGVFVVGTDTNVGKTQVASALLRALADRGERPSPFKPFESGVVRGRPTDAEVLRDAARSRDPFSRICPYRFRAALAPGIAAHRERVRIDRSKVLAAFSTLSRAGRPVIVEGAGGLLVPLAGGFTVADLVVELGLRALVVGRDALGTINHCALTIEALRSRAVGIAGVILNRTVPMLDGSEEDNATAIASLTGERVLCVLPHLKSPRARLSAHARAVEGRLGDIGLL
jgi:dethiobiotin synthetase